MKLELVCYANNRLWSTDDGRSTGGGCDVFRFLFPFLYPCVDNFDASLLFSPFTTLLNKRLNIR